MTWTIRLLIAVLLALGMAGFSAAPTHAATTIVVPTCDQSHLLFAVTVANTDNAGDTITFACSGTINITDPLDITDSMTIDGSHQSVTLDGGNSHELLVVSSGVTFGLTNLTLSHGSADSGGAISSAGDLSITNSTFSDNTATCASCASFGGAILANGTISITDSTFSGNTATCTGHMCSATAGAIENSGSMTITGTTFSDNSATCNTGGCLSYGGAFYEDGDADITDSTFSDNSTSCNGDLCSTYGGAIYNDGTMTLTDSTLSANSVTCTGISCINTGGGIQNGYSLTMTRDTLSDNSAPYTGSPSFDNGGAIDNEGDALTVTDSTISGNSTSPNHGSPIYNNGTADISGSTLSGNSGYGGGAIDNESTLTVTTSTLSGNSSDDAGAMYNRGSASITKSTISGNSSNSYGAIYNLATLTISNTTMEGNTATYFTGGIYNDGYGTTSITNSTFSGNSAVHNNGALDNSFGTLAVGGSIVADTAGNCAGVITDRGYNLEWSGAGNGDTCGFSSANHDITGQDPLLGPLADNGGPTKTMALLPGSPAIDQIPMSYDIPTTTTPLCPTTDQRGYTRPDDTENVCDMGVYESAYVVPTVTITSSANPSTFDQRVTFTAHVTGAGGIPTGTVQFTVDGVDLGGPVPVVNGVATSPAISTLSLGSHTVTADYSGGGEFLAGTGTLTQVVILPTTKTACLGTICPSVLAKFNVSGVSGMIKVTEGTNGALIGSLLYTDSTNPSGNVPGCYTGSPSCAFTVTGFTCSGTSATIYGTWTYRGMTHEVRLDLAGRATSWGTITIAETTSTGIYTKTISGLGIVSVMCP